jgi:hypothetical protein
MYVVYARKKKGGTDVVVGNDFDAGDAVASQLSSSSSLRLVQVLVFLVGPLCRLVVVAVLVHVHVSRSCVVLVVMMLVAVAAAAAVVVVVVVVINELRPPI